MKKKNLKWFIEIDEVHSRIIMDALDVYARVKIGQVDRIEDLFYDTKPTVDFQDVREGLVALKKIVFKDMSQSASYGIGSTETPESAKIAYEIKKTIEHRVSWDKAGNPSKRDWKTMIGVNFDTPMKHSQHPMPKILTVRQSKLLKLLEKD